MECKFSLFVVSSDPPTELIDTLWNVNVETGIEVDAITKELIDTLWNVN